MFMNQPIFAGIAAALAMSGMHFNRGPRAGQAPARGILKPARYSEGPRKADPARRVRRAQVKQFGRRQALRIIRAQRAAARAD